MLPPYIGITDFASAKQARRSAEHFVRHAAGIPHKLHVGVMMSRKTLDGIPSKWTSVFPEKERVARIFIRHPRVLNVLHYAEYDGIDVLAHLIQVQRYGGAHLHAIQLDMIWPASEELKAFRDEYPEVSLILQIGETALERLEGRPERVIEQLARYGKTIDTVLMDLSMGRGRPLLSGVLAKYLGEITLAFPHLRLAVAGGLGPDTTHLVRPLLEEFPELSVDAQSKLRTSGNAAEPIEWERADEYVERMVELIRATQSNKP